MKRKSTYVFLAAALAMLVMVPGRFVYGFVLVIEFNFLMVIGSLSISLVKKLKLEELQSVAVLFLILSATVLFRQIIILLQPEIALTLSFHIYLIPLSFFMIGYVFNNAEKKLYEKLTNNLFQTMFYSIFALCFFFIRDIFGYGTFTFFGKGHQIYEKILLNSNKIGVFSIIASIPGALILSGIILSIHTFFRNKFDVINKAEVSK